MPLADDVDRKRVETAIRRAAREIAEARADGDMGDGRRMARAVAEELVDVAGPPMPKREDVPTDPRGLADLIRRR